MKIFKDINSKNTALLVIDMVNFCVHEKFENKKLNITFKKIRKMSSRLNEFIDNYREKKCGKIIFVNLTPWQKKYLPDNIKNLYKDPNVCFYAKGNKSFGSEFYNMAPERSDYIITKNTYDAFSNFKLEKIAKKNKIKYFVITGVLAEGCVLATVANGFSKGYNFIVLEDLIETYDNKDRQKLKNSLIKIVFPFLYGKVMNSTEFLKYAKR